MIHNDTIVALATPSGNGAIAVIRLSGKDGCGWCAAMGEDIWRNKKRVREFGAGDV